MPDDRAQIHNSEGARRGLCQTIELRSIWIVMDSEDALRRAVPDDATEEVQQRRCIREVQQRRCRRGAAAEEVRQRKEEGGRRKKEDREG